ncbi:thiamine transporter [Melghirimyces profundicolus]|uniref:Thiamine transporter n=1 Tax=Melghirimyces profundicolus TaxID=1242148 RepID=A0A2T6BYS5_9BACL|nr:energy-coupled thiamine transporter ThiT [Melghirimyces profundicolus]PTX61230.1 thiamine transporter [Melghirimyces profundicolus]
MERRRLITMLEVAVMAGAGGLFSVLLALKLWPQGGSVSLAMVPVVLVAFRRGWVAGLLCGLLVGLINLIMNPFIVHPVQVVLDYPLAYSVLGLAGCFRLNRDIPATSLTGRVALGVTVAGLARLLSHFISGVIWFGAFAPEGFSPALYSLLYNASYIVPEILISIAVTLLLALKAPELVRRK